MTEENCHFVSAHTVSNQFEADALLDALEREGIPTLFRSFVETPYNGLFVGQRGWGLIMVPEDRLPEAQQAIQSLISDVQSKRIYTDPGDIDPLLWETLREHEPTGICTNAMIQFDPARRAYRVPFLDIELLCLLDEERIEASRPTPIHRFCFELSLAVLHYLLEARQKPLSGHWASEKDLPGGELFFRGPHAFPTAPLLALFGAEPSLFKAAAERLGGTPVPMGDAAYRLWALPRIPMLFILWAGDDEFEPALHIRFDRSVTEHLESLGTLFALVNVVSRSLRTTVKQIMEERGA